MGLSITADHWDLAASVRGVLSTRDAAAAARAALDGPAGRPSFWPDVAKLGWLGLPVAEEFGGQGFGFPELAVVCEELGRVVAPGPFLPTALAIAVIDAAGTDRATLLPSLCDGTVSAAVGLHGDLRREADGTLRGDAGPVLGGADADLLLLAVGPDLVLVRPGDTDVVSPAATGLDLTRRSVRVVCTGARPVATLPGARDTALTLGRVLAAAEAVGGAAACTERAVAYAKQRTQFGRTIGSFQAVKHLCAQMLVDTELATAAAWDAARAAGENPTQARFAAAVAADIALEAFVRVAERNVQVHGGIGFTWEHDAHLYLRRAHELRAVFGNAAGDVAEQAIAGVERTPALDLPPEAETFRAEVREFVARYHQAPEAERRSLLVHSGYGFPHWPTPFGRAAGPVEQLVIEQELREVPKVLLGIGDWILLTLLRHGNPDQIDRWLWPSLEGRHVWCQLFSEPGAGSDAAAISTKAIRADGGWVVSGQKVWTSGAQLCDRGLATVRTDPDVPKHRGITTLVIDLHAPGVTVRPLREMTGSAAFNEVFFDDVFVPDEDVVGAVNDGWTVARATLGNERVGIGGSSHEYVSINPAIAAPPADPGLRRDIGHLVAERQAVRLLAFRNAARAVAGGDPGPEGNIAKLLVGEHTQRVAELRMRLGGVDAALDGDPALHAGLLFARALTIAGGTSEVVRNQIAERLLGLPREQVLN